jgi:hypothetical protein
MRRIPNFYVVWLRRETVLALPDIVYDCHHQVEYVSSIVAYARRSKLTGIERSMVMHFILLPLSLHGLSVLLLHIICSPSLQLPTLALPNGLHTYSTFFNSHSWVWDRLCGLVARFHGYRFMGPGFDSRRYQIFWELVGLERGPLSLVRIFDDLLERKVAAPV